MKELFPPSILAKRDQILQRGFTLVEMLVSISVLVLLIVLVTQLLGSATKVTTGSRNHMETDAQARLVFDRMATDFGSMLKRKDVDYVFNKEIGNDNFAFYSEAPAYYTGTASSKSPVSLIGYRINQTTLQLERLGKGLSWDGATSGTNPGAVVFLTYAPAVPPSTTPTLFQESTISSNWPSTANPASTDTDYHVISDQVYRLEFCYLMKGGGYSLTRDTSKNFQDVSGIVVAIAILDNNSRKIGTVTKTTSDTLPDPTDAEIKSTPPTLPTLMSQKWQAAVNDSDFAEKSKIPQTAAGQVRIYQRTFYLNNTTDF